MNFQQIILIVAIILLIISLIVVGMALKHPTSSSWPPAIAPCPDYWITQNGTSICSNVHNLGNDLPQCKTMNFDDAQFTGADGNCAKKTWAGGCNVTWDGITYGYGKNDPCAIEPAI